MSFEGLRDMYLSSHRECVIALKREYCKGVRDCIEA
jgi:hypothetical protein